jgi:hypothetical protein
MKFFVFMFCLFFSVMAGANTTHEHVGHISGLMQELVSDRPNHILNKDESKREMIAREILEASNSYPVAFPELILFISYRESQFNPRAIGDDGRSTGIMQIGFAARRVCKKEMGFDLRKRSDQLKCGAYWVQRLAEECGSLHSGLAAYSSKKGRCGGTPRGARIARQRIRKAKRMRTARLSSN